MVVRYRPESIDRKISLSARRFKEDGDVKYYEKVQDLVQPDRSTLEVKFYDIETYNQNLATTIIEEYFRWVQSHSHTDRKFNLTDASIA